MNINQIHYSKNLLIPWRETQTKSQPVSLTTSLLQNWPLQGGPRGTQNYPDYLISLNMLNILNIQLPTRLYGSFYGPQPLQFFFLLSFLEESPREVFNELWDGFMNKGKKLIETNNAGEQRKRKKRHKVKGLKGNKKSFKSKNPQ